MAAESPRPSVFFRTLGCKVNRAESEAAAAELVDAGWDVRPGTGDSPSVVVVNTCTVTGEADAKARKEIRRALALPGSPVVVVTGCLAAMDPEAVARIDDRVVVVREREHLARELAGLRPAAVRPRPTPAASPHGGPAFRTRAMVKVQDGCDAFCTYCIVPYARGLPRSRPLGRIVEEVRDLAQRGVAEVVVTGVNVGRYGHDGVGLAGLLEHLAGLGPRIRLSSVEPGDLTPAVLDVMASALAHGRWCPHLHVPLQSGSDAVLARMGRTYDTSAYLEIVERVRRALGPVALTTDLIAGMPGETDADAEATERFVSQAGFQQLHVFRYSARAGTPAAAMPDQVPPQVRASRAASLRRLSDGLLARYQAGRVGGTASVVLETAEGGTSEDHLRVRVSGSHVSKGAVRVRLTAVEGAEMLSEPER